jgi:alpha-N-arabinofuranosidase
VLTATWGHIDFISVHAYYANASKDTGSYLRKIDDFATTINAVAATIDHVAAIQRAAPGARGRQASRPVHIAVDEWNSWWGKEQPMRSPPTTGGTGGGGGSGGGATGGRTSGGGDEWGVGRRLLEETYAMEDALLVGGTRG